MENEDATKLKRMLPKYLNSLSQGQLQKQRRDEIPVTGTQKLMKQNPLTPGSYSKFQAGCLLQPVLYMRFKNLFKTFQFSTAGKAKRP